MWGGLNLYFTLSYYIISRMSSFHRFPLEFCMLVSLSMLAAYFYILRMADRVII